MERGISPLIATILLLGFTIVLASLIFRFSGELFESQTLETEKKSSTSLSCSRDINIKVESECILGDRIQLLINNKGSIDIEGFTFQIFSDEVITNNSVRPLPSLNTKHYLPSYQLSPSTLPTSIEKINIFPKIRVNNELVNCDETVYKPKTEELRFCNNPIEDSSYENDFNYYDEIGHSDNWTYASDKKILGDGSLKFFTGSDPSPIIYSPWFGVDLEESVSSESYKVFIWINTENEGSSSSFFKLELISTPAISFPLPKISGTTPWTLYSQDFIPRVDSGGEDNRLLAYHDVNPGGRGNSHYEGLQVVKSSQLEV